jgi:hypothetical protein
VLKACRVGFFTAKKGKIQINRVFKGEFSYVEIFYINLEKTKYIKV